MQNESNMFAFWDSTYCIRHHNNFLEFVIMKEQFLMLLLCKLKAISATMHDAGIAMFWIGMFCLLVCFIPCIIGICSKEKDVRKNMLILLLSIILFVIFSLVLI